MEINEMEQSVTSLKSSKLKRIGNIPKPEEALISLKERFEKKRITFRFV